MLDVLRILGIIIFSFSIIVTFWVLHPIAGDPRYKETTYVFLKKEHFFVVLEKRFMRGVS